MSPTGTPQKRFRDTPLAGAIAAGIFSLVAILLGYWLASLETPVESYDISVSANEYPFADTNIRINEGDEVEILVLAANRTSWNCGVGVTNAMGLTQHEGQNAVILSSANICSLIGYIEGGPHFVVGAYDKSVADVSGSLFLGANDVPPEKCGVSDCWADNDGVQFVKITVTRKQ